MASAFLEELMTVSTEVKRSQIKDAVDALWAALVAEEDPQGRGGGIHMLKREVEGGRRLFNNENNGRIRWQLSPKGRMS